MGKADSSRGGDAEGRVARASAGIGEAGPSEVWAAVDVGCTGLEQETSAHKRQLARMRFSIEIFHQNCPNIMTKSQIRIELPGNKEDGWGPSFAKIVPYYIF